MDPKINFKTEFFYRILDQTLSSLNNRFEELNTFDNIFGFFSNLFSLSEEELLKHYKDLYLKLKDDSRGETNINGIELFNVLKALKLHFLRDPLHEPYNILQYLFENNLFSTFPNTVIALKILLTLPVSVASGERLFSKLK